MFPVEVKGSLPKSVQQYAIEGSTDKPHWYVPSEVPVAFVFNRRNYAVMMATPDHLVDFALGFALTEEIINDPDDIKQLDVILSDKGADLRFQISSDALEKLEVTLRRRNMVGAASCGLCGLENVDTLFKSLPRVSDKPKLLDLSVQEKALQELAEHQPINNATHSVHATAWVSDDGKIQLTREDVGRHNALDKLLGAMALEGVSTDSGFLLISSRCSYEMVEKAARRGVQAIVAISGPTSFALQKAKEAGITIYGKSEDGTVRILQND